MMGVKWFLVKPAEVLIVCALFGLVALSDTISNESIANSTSSGKEDHKGTCLSGWIVSPNKSKCVRYIENLKSWDEAESYCKGFGGHLAALTSDVELSSVRKLCGQPVDGCWVGGRGTNSTVGVRWRWSDNTSHWNKSIFSGRSFHSKCGNLSCQVDNSANSCTLVINSLTSLVADRCNVSRASVCMVNTDKCKHMHCHREYIIILAVVSGLILFTTLAVVIWFLVFRQRKKHKKSRKLTNPSASVLIHPWKIFTSEELRTVTKNFSEGNRLLGDSKTGGTYSGSLPDGTKAVVKRLKRTSFQRKKEFYSEIGRVAKLHHPNLVAMIGCCYDHGNRYIVYEFIANGPLDRWLHHVPRGGRSLNWEMRMKIATSLAQGIAYLHDKVKPQVVHRDIRASNVLLDEEFGAHLMGVGLSKFVPFEVMQERTVIAGGTHGYLAPEFVYRNELTTKSDVYSFGVLLLELVSGRRPVNSSVNIFEWATPLVQAHRYIELVDPVISLSLGSDGLDPGVVQKVVDLVYLCTQNVPSMRPRMLHVVHQLQQVGGGGHTDTPVVT